MNCKPVYLKQQEHKHTPENTLILMLGKVCIQTSSHGNIKLASQAKINIHRLNFSLKLRCTPYSWEKRGHIPSSIHSSHLSHSLAQWRAALGMLYIMPAFLPVYSHQCPSKLDPTAAQWLSRQVIPCSGSVSPQDSLPQGNPKPSG